MKQNKYMFAPALVRRRRASAERKNISAQELPFLYERCALDCFERIMDVNRVFEKTLFIGSPEILAALRQNFDQEFSTSPGKTISPSSPPLPSHRVCKKLGLVTHLNHSNDHAHSHMIACESHLPLRSETFDLVINLMSLHHVNDVPRALAEYRRVLRPDGLMIAACIGGESLIELRHSLYEADDLVNGKIYPRVAPMIRLAHAGSLLQACGYAMPVVDCDRFCIRYLKLTSLYGDLRHMGVRNSLIERSKARPPQAFFTLVEQIYQRDHSSIKSQDTKDQGSEASQKRYLASFEIIWMTGWAPSSTQPKPLKPGSAKTSLAHALGVREHNLKN